MASIYFNEEHETLRKLVRGFVQNEINPHVDQWEEEDIFPAHELFKKMGDLSLLGLIYPEQFGGGADEIMMGIIAKKEVWLAGL